MKRLIIHIGYPKTATTSLQLNLFASLKDEGKIEYLNHLTNNPEYIGNIKIRKLYEYLVGYKNYYDKNNYKLLFSEIDKNISVISAETLSVLYTGISFTNITSGAKNNSKKIKAVFKEYFDKIEVIISIRVQTSIIPRCYKQWFYTIISENKNYNEIGIWIKENFGEKVNDDHILFNYELIYRSYLNIFGKDNVHLLVYEDLKYDKDSYYNNLANIFNCDKQIIKNNLERNMENKSVILEDGRIKTDRQSLHSFLTNKFKNKIKQYSGEGFYSISKKMYKNIFQDSLKNIRFGNENIVRNLTEKENNAIFNRFNESNKRLAEIAGLDENKMKQYKYF